MQFQALSHDRYFARGKSSNAFDERASNCPIYLFYFILRLVVHVQMTC